MSIAPPLSLTREQANRLLSYIQTYRHYTLTQMVPSADRNGNQRLLQTMQGKLIREIDRQETAFYFLVTGEELRALKTMVTDLLVFSAREPASTRRDATLTDLATLKATLERLYQRRDYSHR